MTVDPSIEAFRDRWIAAFNSHDLDAHVALYREDAILFGSIPALVQGREAIRAYFGARPPGTRVDRYGAMEVRRIGPDVAATAAHVDFAMGETLMPYRVTWMLERDGGSWRIVQHHGSPRQPA